MNLNIRKAILRLLLIINNFSQEFFLKMKIDTAKGMAENAVGFTLWCGIAMITDREFSSNLMLLCLYMYYTIFVIGFLVEFYTRLSEIEQDQKPVIYRLPATVLLSCVFLYYFGLFQEVQETYCQNNILNFVIRAIAYITIALCDFEIIGIFCILVHMYFNWLFTGANRKFRNIMLCVTLGHVAIFAFSLRYSLDYLFYLCSPQPLVILFELLAATAPIAGGAVTSFTMYYVFIERGQVHEYVNHKRYEYEHLKYYLLAGSVTEGLLWISMVAWAFWNDIILKNECHSSSSVLENGGYHHRFYLMSSVCTVQLLTLTIIFQRTVLLHREIVKEDEKFWGSFYIKMDGMDNRLGNEKVELSICSNEGTGQKPVVKKFVLPEECCICLRNFQKEDHVMVLKCGHVLHCTCYENLVSCEASNTRCPLCRKILE